MSETLIQLFFFFGNAIDGRSTFAKPESLSEMSTVPLCRQLAWMGNIRYTLHALLADAG